MESSKQNGPISSFPYVLGPNVFLAFMVSLDLSFNYRLLAFCGDAICCVYILCSDLDAGKVAENYVLGLGIAMHIFTACHFLLLTTPLEDYRHERDVIPAKQMRFWQRMYWTMCSVQGFRAVGWNVQVANVPPRSKLSRWSFVYKTIPRIIKFYLLTDACESYIAWNPLFSLTGSNALSLTSQGSIFRCFNIIAVVGSQYGSISMQYLLLAATTVALGLAYPQDWPDIFGSWKHASTVRDFWGKTWHQICRRHLTSISRLVVNTLGYKKGSTGSSYTQLYSTFFFSGLIHACGDAMVGKKYFGSTFLFFPLQAIVITIEDSIIFVFKNYGGKKRTTLITNIGYAWVFIWFYSTTPLFLDWSLKAGMNTEGTVPFSIIKAIRILFK